MDSRKKGRRQNLGEGGWDRTPNRAWEEGREWRGGRIEETGERQNKSERRREE